MIRRLGILIAVLMVAVTGLSLAGPSSAAPAAKLCVDPLSGQCPAARSGDTGGDGSGDASSPYEVTQYTSPRTTSSPRQYCSLYANGRGMGSYCLHGGEENLLSLRERYRGQKFQACRYEPVPEGFHMPYNPDPANGRYMLKTCIVDVDFDTYGGGIDRGVSLTMVWVRNGTDISFVQNGITTFLWHQLQDAKQLPVPFLEARPTAVPVVGTPTYFTFKWLDPSTKDVVAEGRYQGHANGGPLKQMVTGNVLMRAEATEIIFNPNQKGMEPISCKPWTPYNDGALPSGQRDTACKFLFPRSSASAREFSTKEIPDGVVDAFNASIKVRWKVTYGTVGGPMTELGDGFDMNMTQVLPVQEVQAPNLPPAVVF